MNHSDVLGVFFLVMLVAKSQIFQSCRYHEKREKHECQDLPTAQLYLHAVSVQLVIQNT